MINAGLHSGVFCIEQFYGLTGKTNLKLEINKGLHFTAHELIHDENSYKNY